MSLRNDTGLRIDAPVPFRHDFDSVCSKSSTLVSNNGVGHNPDLLGTISEVSEESEHFLCS